MRRKSVKRGQIFPPCKVQYEYVVSQDDFDLDYIRREYSSPVAPVYSNILPKQGDKRFCFDSPMELDRTAKAQMKRDDIATVVSEKDTKRKRCEKGDVSIANLAEEYWYDKRWGFSEPPFVREKKLGSDETKVIEYLR